VLIAAWPLAGYWSSSEYLPPQQCSNPSSCLGIDPAVVGSSTTGVQEYFVDGKKCAEGYTGVTCTQCAADYYQLSGKCIFCGSSTNQDAALTLTIIAAFSVITVLALCVAFLDALPLAEWVTLFVVLQELAIVGVDASKDLPRFSTEVGTFFTYVSDLGNSTRKRLEFVLSHGADPLPFSSTALTAQLDQCKFFQTRDIASTC
jgi:hypothetical protein